MSSEQDTAKPWQFGLRTLFAMMAAIASLATFGHYVGVREAIYVASVTAISILACFVCSVRRESNQDTTSMLDQDRHTGRLPLYTETSKNVKPRD